MTRQDGVPRTEAGRSMLVEKHWHLHAPLRGCTKPCSVVQRILDIESEASELDPNLLAAAISEAMAHVPWPGEQGTITFGGLTYRAAGKAIADEYSRLARPGSTVEPA